MELAARQHGCVSRGQLLALGFSDHAIVHRLERGRFSQLHEAVFVVAPVGRDRRTRWMAATLTAPGTYLAERTAGQAYGFWHLPPAHPVVVRAGDGGPTVYDGVRVHRSRRLEGDTTTLDGIPIVTPERAVIDLAATASAAALSRTVREAIRLRRTTAADLFVAIGRHRGRRGVRRLYVATSLYAGLPVDRSRSDAEAKALELLREWGVDGWRHNHRVAGEEADLSWAGSRVIVEIDGGDFHLDVGEDGRKEAIWRAAGWDVRRLPADDVHLRPERLRALVPGAERH